MLQELEQHRWAQGHLPSCPQQKLSENTSYSLTRGFTTEAAGEQPLQLQGLGLCAWESHSPPHLLLCLPHAQGPRPWDHGADECRAHSWCSQLPSAEKPHTEAHGVVAVIWHLAMSGMTEPSSLLLTIMDLSSSTSCSSSANSLKDSAVRKEEAGQWSWDVALERVTHVRTPQ